MQGVYVKGQRPKTKKILRASAKAAPHTIILEATSLFGNEYEGKVTEMPQGVIHYVVGPDPYTERTWYAQLTRVGDIIKIK